MTEEEFRNAVDLFESNGWRDFIKQIELTESAQTKGAVEGAITNDQWQWLRGYLTCARNTLSYETFVRLSYEQQLKDEKEEASEEAGDTYDATL